MKVQNFKESINYMQNIKKMVLKWKSYIHTMILYHNENGKYEINKKIKGELQFT